VFETLDGGDFVCNVISLWPMNFKTEPHLQLRSLDDMIAWIKSIAEGFLLIALPSPGK